MSASPASPPPTAHLLLGGRPGAYEGLFAAWARDGKLRFAAFEAFTDPRILFESQAWLTNVAAQEPGRPGTVMVGSVERGRWINWNLPSLPPPPVPAYW
ncbi:hypothetical protein [Streptomyces sp. NPDC053755]|uniref:hypothetical protein n=1 Tax=Streptomyces sp. NPDC053755 TaxID=3155815 RepID=UPI0034482783